MASNTLTPQKENLIIMFSKILLCAVVLLLICSCSMPTIAQMEMPPTFTGGFTPVDPQLPPPPASNCALFKGKYWFHSRGVDMFESGVIVADGLCHFTLHSMYINTNLNNGINTFGLYQLTAAGAGTATQGSCNSDLSLCVGGKDVEALFVNTDGTKAMMVSMEGPGQQWAVEMERDPGPILVTNLSTCDARSGAVVGCVDTWIIPANWK